MQLTNPRIVDPYMQVTIKKSCDDSAEPKRRHRGGNTVEYKSYFYGYTCSYNPTFSVGHPWSVGVGITPECGEERVALLGDKQTDARDAYRFKLETDGYAFSWDDRETDTVPTSIKLCTSASGYFVLKDTDCSERGQGVEEGPLRRPLRSPRLIDDLGEQPFVH